MDVKRIGVLGAGTMGNGIAQVCAVSGYEVVMRDVTDELLGRAMDGIGGSLQRLVSKEKLSAAERDAAIGRISPTTEVDALSDIDVCIEAATENPELKLDLFRQLDELCRAEAILASNTSSISLTRIAAVTGRPERVVGMHFFNPAPLMRLVEIIRALQTSDATYETVRLLAESLGKSPVGVNDSPGFVVNRILVPMINEAIYALSENLATAQEIDAAMKLGANHPMGPLALADLIGLDVCLYVMEVLQSQLGDPKYRPCPLLRKMVDAGYLGRKSGRGFFSY